MILHVPVKVQCPFIRVEVEGIGQLTALVDTGARSSVLAYEQVPDGVALKPVSRDYRSVDGSYVMNIVGEIDITVVFESKVVHLTEVAVLRELPYPMLLRMDFISKGNVTITGGGSGASVAIQEEVKEDRKGLTVGFGRFTVEDVKRKLEEIDWKDIEKVKGNYLFYLLNLVLDLNLVQSFKR